MTKTDVPTYQIKITLRHSKPPIWRRVLVSADTTLAEFHYVIQAAMGWWNAHLHMFTINEQQYTIPLEPGYLQEMDARDSSRVKLQNVVKKEGDKFDYDYDFGDYWQHIVVLEKILLRDPKQKLPVCIKGKRACPPEDVGGVWGYDHFLEAINDPAHPDHEMFSNWIDGDFDPAAFDLDEVNGRLAALR